MLTACGMRHGAAFFRVGKFLNKGVLVGGDPFTKESKYCLKTIDGKEECSEVAICRPPLPPPPSRVLRLQQSRATADCPSPLAARRSETWARARAQRRTAARRLFGTVCLPSLDTGCAPQTAAGLPACRRLAMEREGH